MSIIYDALKKVEGSSGKVRDKITKFKITKGPNKSKFKAFLLYLVLVCLGLFIANIFFVLLAKLPKINIVFKVKNQARVSKNQNIPAYQESPKEKQIPKTASPVLIDNKEESKESFVLSGVFFSNDEGYALINNRIVREGDKINEATVVRIALGEAELDLQGKIIKLSSNPR